MKKAREIMKRHAPLAAKDGDERREWSPRVPEIAPQSGKPIDADARSFLEPAFGRGFADVRVHADADADLAAQAMDAHAFTLGQDIYFRSGSLDPSRPAGLHLLAHEVAHTVDDPVPAPLEEGQDLLVSEPTDAAEGRATRDAQRVMAGESAQEVGTQAGGEAGGATVHRFGFGDIDLSKQFGGIGPALGTGFGGLFGGGGGGGGGGGLLGGLPDIGPMLGPIGVGMGAPDFGGGIGDTLGSLGQLATGIGGAMANPIGSAIGAGLGALGGGGLGGIMEGIGGALGGAGPFGLGEDPWLE